MREGDVTQDVRDPFVFENLRGEKLQFWLTKRHEGGAIRYSVFANEKYTAGEGVYGALLIPHGAFELRVHEIDNCEEFGISTLAGKGIGPAIFRDAMREEGRTIVSSSVKFASSTNERRSQKAECFWRRLHARDLSWYRESDDRWVFRSHIEPCPICDIPDNSSPEAVLS